MLSLINDLIQFEIYLRGGASKHLKTHFQYYAQNLNELKKNYHQTIVSSQPEITLKVKSILQNLNIPPEKWDEYLNLTVYNLLLKLHHDGHPQISYILELIDNKTAVSKLKLVIAGGVIVTLIASLLALPAFYGVLQTIGNLLISVIGLPILGLIFNVASTIFYFYQNHVDPKKTLFNRLRDNFFLLANAFVNIAAYSVWIAASAPMTPLVAGLFVLASGIDVIKEVVALIQENARFRNKPPLHDASPLLVHQDYIRQSYGFKKHKKALLINLGTSIVLLAIMAGWCFIPGSLLVSIGAVALIGITYGVKHLLLKTNELTIREQLQVELREKERVYMLDHDNLNEPLISPALSLLTSAIPAENQLIIEESPPISDITTDPVHVPDFLLNGSESLSTAFKL
ncbi:hypothetical protein [Legionella cardiaca]|uniref:Coiled-coil protein n=1 Tax=Legionella cardiaca TaxID=1071983 RepID=A0ABY8AUZ4_9GAMM|nr:hypothetical protein [Legionella cardiaca]WED43569.1 hypothetical protein PXX05_01985 [Legionella cardiaca]